MKNITLSVEEVTLRAARERARQEQRTLNQAFRAWIRQYASRGRSEDSLSQLMDRLSYADAGKSFGRDERNER